VLQYVAVCCSVPLYVLLVHHCQGFDLFATPVARITICCSELQSVAVCRSALQRVAVCCSVL